MSVFLICVILLPVIQGLGFIRLKRNRETVSLTECYMLGLLFLFLLAQAVSCAVIKLEYGFSVYCRILSVLILVCSVLSLVLNWKTALLLWQNIKERFLRGKGEKGEKTWRYLVELFISAALLGLQIAAYFIYAPEAGGDTTVETVSVTLLTNTVFAYNPLTGGALRYGMYPVYKLASLPLLYAALQRLCGIPLLQFLYCIVPIWMLVLAFVLMARWGGFIFGQKKETGCMFLIFLQLLLLTGDGEKTSYAYALLHGGWKGATIAAAIIFPFGVYMIFVMIRYKDWLYGTAGILLSLCGLLFTRALFLPERFAFTGGDTGRQWGTFALAALALYLMRERTHKLWKKYEVALLLFSLFGGLVCGSAFCAVGTACALAALWGVAQEWKKGKMAAVGFVVMIFMVGTILPFGADSPKIWDIPAEETEALDKILTLAESYERNVTLAAPERLMERARLLDGRILLPYGKDLWYEDCNREIADVYTEEEALLYKQMKTDYEQPDAAATVAANTACDILVLRERMSEESRRRYGWQEACEVSPYILYYRQKTSQKQETVLR